MMVIRTCLVCSVFKKAVRKLDVDGQLDKNSMCNVARCEGNVCFKREVILDGGTFCRSLNNIQLLVLMRNISARACIKKGLSVRPQRNFKWISKMHNSSPFKC